MKNVPISPTENLNSENEAKKSEEIFDLKSPNSNTMETDTEILPLKSNLEIFPSFSFIFLIPKKMIF